ncbi:hypothetical protein [Holophaga foetida]|uniref:hypothetical protein n=1 Tax=Holophaga foetida TaxID=35839 RepID=UPI0002471C8D|nr:hypothetical protein [Holophaga foetida]
MSDRVQVIQHKGVKIVVSDCRGYKPEQYCAQMKDVQRALIGGNIGLLFQDLTDTVANEEAKNAAKACEEAVSKARGKKTFSAMIGVTGIQKIIANAVEKGQYFASSREDALDWLVARSTE